MTATGIPHPHKANSGASITRRGKGKEGKYGLTWAALVILMLFFLVVMMLLTSPTPPSLTGSTHLPLRFNQEGKLDHWIRIFASALDTSEFSRILFRVSQPQPDLMILLYACHFFSMMFTA